MVCMLVACPPFCSAVCCPLLSLPPISENEELPHYFFNASQISIGSLLDTTMMSTTKRRRIGDTPADGASKLPSGLSVASTSSFADDQQPAVEAQGLISDRYLPAWLSIFRSGNGDPKSLGRLATRTSKALTQLLESGQDNRDEIWSTLCRQQLGRDIYEAIPLTIKESLGPRRLLAQMGAGPAKRHTAMAKKASLKEPTLTAENTTFVVKVWKDDQVIISQTVRGMP